MTDRIPTRYRLALDTVGDNRAIYTTDFDTYPTGNLIVQFHLAREDWVFMGRPTELDVTVSLP